MAENDRNDGDSTKVNDDRSDRFDAYLLWLFICGVIAWLLVILVSIYLPNLTQRTRFFTESTLSLFVLVAIIAQVLIYRGQWKVMSQQLEAMKKQANLTERSFHIASRAHVFISEATLKSPISSGDFPLPNVVLKNSGRTPSYKNRVRLEQAFLTGEVDEKAREGIMPEMRPLGEKGCSIIGAGEFSTMHPAKGRWKSDEERELELTGLSTFYVWGLIRYSDIFGTEHSCRFSLYARNPNVTGLSFGLYGNDVEEEEVRKTQTFSS